jgi:hypothetical protein
MNAILVFADFISSFIGNRYIMNDETTTPQPDPQPAPQPATQPIEPQIWDGVDINTTANALENKGLTSEVLSTSDVRSRE